MGALAMDPKTIASRVRPPDARVCVLFLLFRKSYSLSPIYIPRFYLSGLSHSVSETTFKLDAAPIESQTSAFLVFVYYRSPFLGSLSTAPAPRHNFSTTIPLHTGLYYHFAYLSAAWLCTIHYAWPRLRLYHWFLREVDLNAWS